MTVVLTPNIGDGKGTGGKEEGKRRNWTLTAFHKISEFFSPACSEVYKSSKDVNVKNNIVNYKIGIHQPGYVRAINRPKM